MLARVGLFMGRPLSGEPGPRIDISASSIAENASIGDLVGTLSVVNGSGSYAFTITADPDSKFAIDLVDDTRLELAATLDYETATSHSVTISADNGVDDPVVRILSVTVTDVAEGGGPSGSGIQLETADFLLAENGDYLIQEAA